MLQSMARAGGQAGADDRAAADDLCAGDRRRDRRRRIGRCATRRWRSRSSARRPGWSAACWRSWPSRSSRNRGKAVPSSTSSSEPPKGIVQREGALPAGPAADRVRPPGPGAAGADARHSEAAVGQDPGGRRGRACRSASPRSRSNARRIGLHAGDLDNSEVAWVKERIRSESAAVAIVGDSRILFDTDLDRFEALTGARPVQLAIHGTSALTLLEDAADNPNFKGLLIVGLADTMFFQPFDGYGGYVRHRNDFTSPSGRARDRDRPCAAAAAGLPRFQLSPERRSRTGSIRISVPASKGRRTTSGSCRRSASAARPGCGRASNMIHAWRARTRWAWKGFKEKFPYTPELIAKGHARAKAAVDKIRARGGEVVFVRPPSAPQLRVNEEAQVPKAKGWDHLLQQHAQRRRSHRRLGPGAGTDPARMVAPQPQMLGGVHRRLCPQAHRADAAAQAARRCAAAAWPGRLRAGSNRVERLERLVLTQATKQHCEGTHSVFASPRI